MRFLHLATLGALSTAIAIAACGGSVEQMQTGAGTGASGGGVTTSVTTTSGGDLDAGPDVDNGMPSTMYPAPHPGPPVVITGGGPVLKSPTIYPIFFSNDDPAMVTQIKDFVAKLPTATNYWTAVTSEYGVGALSSADPIDLTETAMGTTDDNAIQTWLEGKLNGDDPAFPMPDENTLFVIHYPAALTITMSGGFGGSSSSCTDFGGYHNNITLDAAHGNKLVAYAVVPRCASFGDLMGIDAVTGAESHEIIEAATDPYPQDEPAYAQTDEAHLYWTLALGGGEVGDMCAQNPTAFTKFPEIPYTVQRSWSNKAAKAGNDPCVPALPGEVYFNTVPNLTDDITLNFGQTITMKGVQIPVGQSKTIDLDLFSDGDTGGPWTVEVLDSSALMGGSPTLGLSLDRTQGQNGEKLHLTIDVMKASQFKAEVFYLLSKKAGTTNIWVGLVGN